MEKSWRKTFFTKKIENNSYTVEENSKKRKKFFKKRKKNLALRAAPPLQGEHAAPTVSPARELTVPDGPSSVLQPAPPLGNLPAPPRGPPAAPSSAAPPGPVPPPAALSLSPCSRVEPPLPVAALFLGDQKAADVEPREKRKREKDRRKENG